MRKVLSLVASLLVISAVVAAQHANMKETPVKTALTLASDVQFGPQVLKAGDYKVMCDREMIVFKSAETGKKVLETKCQGKELAAPSTETQLYVKTLANGTKTVDRLLLKGSPVEHVF